MRRLILLSAVVVVVFGYGVSLAWADTIQVPVDYGTIQDAINAAAVGDTIEVADGTYSGTGNVNLDFGGKNIHLKSAGGAANCIIDCESSGRGFYFHSGETSEAIVDGFTVTNGNGNNYMGGAMYFVSGTPTIRNCIMTGNSTNYGGGAVAIMGSASPSFDNCLIANNNAYSFGGGVYCYATNATPTFTNCTIADNHGSFGGGIFNAYANPTLNNCIIRGNTDNINIAREIRNQSGTFTLNNCCYADGWGNVYGTVIVNNCTTDDPLFLDAEAGDYHLKIGSPCIDTGDSTLVPEDVIEDLDGRDRVWGANVEMGPYEGGTALVPSDYPTIQNGLDAANDGDVVLVADGVYTGFGEDGLDFAGKAIHLKSEGGPENCIIVCSSAGSRFHDQETPRTIFDGFRVTGGSTAYDGGAFSCVNGASPTIMNCIIEDCVSFGCGGAVYCDGSSPSIISCTIQYNDAFNGGGICCTNGSNPYIYDCTISDNYAANDGGGVHCNASNPNIRYCRIRDNEARNNGGGVCCVYSSDPTIYNCTMAKNRADNYGGGLFCGYNSSPTVVDSPFIYLNEAKSGGGIYSYSDSDPTIDNCLIMNNSAEDDGGGICCLLASDPLIFNCQVLSNSADDSGGGIYCGSDAWPDIKHCTISGNSAVNEGGGIFSAYNGSYPLIVNTTITDNSAWNGGGICGQFDSYLHVYGCSITGNSAENEGGGISSREYCLPKIVDCTISSNSAGFDGGGVCFSNFSDGVISGSTITDNSALDGAGIMCRGSIAEITNCTIKRNISEGAGAGVAVYWYSDAVLTNCLIVTNESIWSGGGGIFSGYSNATLNNCTIADNSAWDGGGVCISFTAGTSDVDYYDIVANNTIIVSNTAAESGHDIYTGTPGCDMILDYSSLPGGLNRIEGEGYVNLEDARGCSWPVFVGGGNYRLHNSSNFIDKGNNALAAGITTDLDGEDRVINLIVDLGCYENTGPRKWAVIVGISHYPDPGMPYLYSPVGDATRLRQTLTGQDDEWDDAYSKGHVHLLTLYWESGWAQSVPYPGHPYGVSPSKENIQAKIENTVASLRPDDTFLFYFIGHGDVDNRNAPTKHCLVPTNGVAWGTGGDCPNENISEEELKQWLSGAPADAKVLVVIDACYSGGMDDLFVSPGPTREIVTSARKDQKAFESPRLDPDDLDAVHAIFTWNFMRVLEDTTTDQVALPEDPEGGALDGFISSYEAYRKVMKRLGDPNIPPEYPTPQHIDWYDNVKLNFVKAP